MFRRLVKLAAFAYPEVKNEKNMVKTPCKLAYRQAHHIVVADGYVKEYADNLWGIVVGDFAVKISENMISSYSEGLLQAQTENDVICFAEISLPYFAEMAELQAQRDAFETTVAVLRKLGVSVDMMSDDAYWCADGCIYRFGDGARIYSSFDDLQRCRLFAAIKSAQTL